MKNLSFTSNSSSYFKLCSLCILWLLFLCPGHVVSNDIESLSNAETKPPIKITGTVISAEDKLPIPGVNVMIKGSNIGTITDIDGNYNLEVSSPDAVLVFSFVGYKPIEIPVANQTIIDVTLEEDLTRLEEVVLVGYTSKRKEDIISAVSEIDLEDTKDVPASDVSRLLLGQAAGVIVNQGTGRPGQELNISIRGMGSLGTDSNPLYVVDGYPVGSSLGGSVNPSDIESITVLKDAASTSIYGARGSNGVILITTKTGKAGKTKITLDAITGVQSIPDSRRFDMMNAVEFGQFQRESFIDRFILNQNRTPTEEEIPEGIRNPENNTTSTDWFDEILNDTPLFEKYNINISSGGEKTKSFISLGYLNQDGILRNTNFKRFNARANIATEVTKNITTGLNVSASRSKERYVRDGSRNEVVGIALWADPREPVYNEDGTFNNYLGGNNTEGDLISGSVNPVQLLHEEKNERSINRIFANAYAEISFLNDFKFKSTINASLANSRANEFRPSTLATNDLFAPRPPQNAILREEYIEEANWSTDQLISYAKTLGERHNFDVLLGFTAQENTWRNIYSQGTDFPDDIVQFLQNAESVNTSSGERSWSLLAYFVQANYDFSSKYLVSASYRREGSSRFGEFNRWGNFPAASLGWRISEEPFLKNQDWLYDLKLRASYGVTGNNNIGDYTSLSTLRDENYIIGNNLAPGKVLSSLSNPNLGWEESRQFNYGIDLAVLDNRLVFTAEYYNRLTENMLLPINIPAISGFETIFTNIGEVENTGFEFKTSFQNAVNQNFGYHASFNISFNRNKVIEVDGDNDEIRTGGDFYGANNVSKVGRPIGILYGYRNLGVFQNQEEISTSPTQDGAIPGSFKYLDANNDGIVSYDRQDWVEIGNPHPDFIWSLNAGMNYKAFDLSVILTGAQNYDVYRNIETSTINLDGIFNVERRAMGRYRSPEMPGNGSIPTSNNWKWEREANSFYVYDASHVWVRNISLGYKIPFHDSFINSARVFINGDNLLLISDFPGGNPEVNTSGGISPGIDNQPYPLPRTLSIGANITF